MARSPKVTIRLQAEHARAAVEAAAAAFPPGNPQGVFGAAVGPKGVRGRPTCVPTLRVFVARKLDNPRAPVEPVAFTCRGARRVVLPDVVATGRRVVMAAGGAPHYRGLFAGSAIRAQSTASIAGAVTCLCGTSGGPTHLLTAGHLFARGASGAIVKAAAGPRQPERDVGRLVHNLLDDREAPLDAALVELTKDGRQMATATGPDRRPRRFDALPLESAHVASVWLKVFLPTKGDYVGRLGGELSPNVFHARSPFGVEETLRDVITTRFAGNVRGNSGTILMTENEDPAPQAVGLAVGHTDAFSLHVPLDRVLQRIKAAHGKNLRVWSR